MAFLDDFGNDIGSQSMCLMLLISSGDNQEPAGAGGAQIVEFCCQSRLVRFGDGVLVINFKVKEVRGESQHSSFSFHFLSTYVGSALVKKLAIFVREFLFALDFQ